jgi:hypothetical protein
MIYHPILPLSSHYPLTQPKPNPLKGHLYCRWFFYFPTFERKTNTITRIAFVMLNLFAHLFIIFLVFAKLHFQHLPAKNKRLMHCKKSLSYPV